MNHKIDLNKIEECSLREAQLIMLDILKEVHRICEKHNLRYFLSDGTLLGAVRHQGFIPWDDDLDISMPREDYNKFMAIAQGELSEDYFMQTMKTDPYYKLYHVPLKVRYNKSLFIEDGENHKKYHQGIYIDIFPMDKAPDSMGKYSLQSKLSKFLLVSKMKINTRDFPSVKFFGRTISQVLGKAVSFKMVDKILFSTYKWNKEATGEYYTQGPEIIWSHRFKSESLFPLKKIKFEDSEFWVPNKPEDILTIMFGDFMKLPPEDQRLYHAKFIGKYKDEEAENQTGKNKATISNSQSLSSEA